MTRRPATLRALLVLAALGATAAGAGAFAAPKDAPPAGSASRMPFALVQDRDVDDRLPQPEDRYAVAGGCYTVEAPGQGFVTEKSGELGVSKDARSAAPFHFQATRLGEYLIATNKGRDTRYEGATWDVRGYLAAGSTAGLLPASTVAVASAPSEAAEWRLVASGKRPDAKTKASQTYVLSVPSRGASLAVQDGRLALAAKGSPLRLRHVPDDNPKDGDRNGTRCASWPEIDPGASGKPEPTGQNPTSRVQGLFDAHVHGMAFEFLGGELRCGRPWHEYGVEFALGSCDAEKNSANRLLEVPLGGNPATYAATYDPQGWPTFKSWPQNRTLTHEQFYWRWLERAHAGGLRLMTNLLVENRALCEQYPVKKNSCNEMDSVRLQAKRAFELQDYIDAQSGGPGEGWYRIVGTPAQARQSIHAGRLAVTLGIENSALFDCEVRLDQPQCTKQQIDDRLQEAFDMGVRQVQLVNKFDNALAGVTGDPGTTGVVVNQGNRYVTGAFWDMLTCNEDNDGHSHERPNDLEATGEAVDRLQLSPTDATPAGAEGVDALAGRVLDTFGTVRKFAAPAYGPGPHCNSSGLSELGKHTIRSIVAKGMIFDPDHMSARAQREALDLIQFELVPAERKAAAKAGRAPVQPSLMSSHSWSNPVVYQRMYELDGVVAPYANEPTRYVKDWVDLRRYAAKQARPRYDFGMGYGADTNGLGGQPPPRKDPKRSLKYTAKGFPAPIGGIRLTQQKSGLRTFDVTKEGVAMYGLFADWLQETLLAADELAPKTGGGKQLLSDMLDGSETYLQMWERAVYGVNDCVTDQSSLQSSDLHAALGLNLEGFLDAVGQPADRSDDAYVYCAQDEDGRTVVLDVLFDAAGKAETLRPSTSGVQPTDVVQPAASAQGGTALARAGTSAAPADGPGDGHLHEHDATGQVVQKAAPELTPLSAGSSTGGLGVLLLLAVTALATGTLAVRLRQPSP